MADFDWTRLRILIVDGDLDFLSWGDSTLREAGVAEVRCTMVGSDAVNILRQFSADAVVLDLDSEEAGGLDTLGQLRDERTSPNPNVPVVLKADPADTKKIREACKIGVESLFRKSVDTKTFLSRVRGAIRAPRRLIAAETYFGPDRRWGEFPFEGEERRVEVAEAVAAAETAVPRAGANDRRREQTRGRRRSRPPVHARRSRIVAAVRWQKGHEGSIGGQGLLRRQP